MNLRITQAAMEALRSIRVYTLETWGADQEQHYLDRIWTHFEKSGRIPGGTDNAPTFFPDAELPPRANTSSFSAQTPNNWKSSGFSAPPWISNVTYHPIPHRPNDRNDLIPNLGIDLTRRV
jgi:plasmid stabilization system protein ParE